MAASTQPPNPNNCKKVLIEAALDAKYRAMKAECTRCFSKQYTRFRYFNNKTAMLNRAVAGQPLKPQARFACRSPQCLARNPGKIEVEFTLNGKTRGPYQTTKIPDHKRKKETSTTAPNSDNINKRAKLAWGASSFQQQAPAASFYVDPAAAAATATASTSYTNIYDTNPAASSYNYCYNYSQNNNNVVNLQQTTLQMQMQQLRDVNVNVVVGIPLHQYNYMGGGGAAAAAGTPYINPMVADFNTTYTSVTTNNVINDGNGGVMKPVAAEYYNQPLPPLVDAYDVQLNGMDDAHAPPHQSISSRSGGADRPAAALINTSPASTKIFIDEEQSQQQINDEGNDEFEQFSEMLLEAIDIASKEEEEEYTAGRAVEAPTAVLAVDTVSESTHHQPDQLLVGEGADDVEKQKLQEKEVEEMGALLESLLEEDFNVGDYLTLEKLPVDENLLQQWLLAT